MVSELWSMESAARAMDVTEDPDASPSDLAPLARHWDEYVRERVASHGNTPGPALMEMASDTCLDVVAEVAENESTPGEALAVLATSTYATVRVAVAGNRSTPRGTLGILAKDEDVEVRYAVACNQSTHPATLTELVADRRARVSGSAFVNPARLL